MTHIHLIQALASELKELLSHVKMPTEYATEPTADNFIAVNIFEQYLPKNLFEETAYFPFVVIEWLETQDNLKEGSTAQIGLTFGTYAHEENGWIDAFYLMELVRERLLSKRLIANRFWLADEINWRIESNQPSPFFILYGTLTYEIFQPQDSCRI